MLLFGLGTPEIIVILFLVLIPFIVIGIRLINAIIRWLDRH